MSSTKQELYSRISQLPPDKAAQLVERLRGRKPRPPAAGCWFMRQPKSNAALRLFCFSYAGSGASIFRTWNHLLPDQVEVCAIQLPGRESRATESPYRQLEPLVADLHEAIEPLLDKRFAMFGHSMGALLAFELARQLRRTGAPQPDHLLLSAFRAPQLPNPNIRIFHLPDEVLKTVLLKEGTPEEVLRNDELMRLLLPTLRADFEVCDTYEFVPEPPLSMPVSIFGGTQDVRVGRSDLEPWQAQAEGEFSVTMLPGSHFFIHNAQDLLLAQLSTRLAATKTLEGM